MPFNYINMKINFAVRYYLSGTILLNPQRKEQSLSSLLKLFLYPLWVQK